MFYVGVLQKDVNKIVICTDLMPFILLSMMGLD